MDANAYEALTIAHDDARWAFGTGFDDPLAGVDTRVPDGVDEAELARVCLALADDAFVMSHRLSEWVARLPELEEETAVANIALDLLGQARLLYGRAGSIEGRTEDDYAYFREQHEFRNARFVELRIGDFADLVARVLAFADWRLRVLDGLRDHPDPVLRAVARKGRTEVAYHRDYAVGWLVRLGDGTDESHRRMQAALDRLWPWLAELGEPLALDDLVTQATLTVPDLPPAATLGGRTGRDGVHTEALSYLLAESQSVARAHPGATW